MNEAQILLERLKEKHGGHREASDALGITYRTYVDWRRKAEGKDPIHHKDQWKIINVYLRHMLECVHAD